MKTECPHCKQHYEIDKQYNGQVIECTTCKNEFYVEPYVENAIQPTPQTKTQVIKETPNSKSRLALVIGVILFFSLIALAVLFFQNFALKNQIETLKNDIISHQKTIDELKFGPERLKAEAEVAVKEGNLEKAKEIYENLFVRHPHKKNDSTYMRSFNGIVQQIKDKERRIAQQKAQLEAALLANISKNYDHMQSITWYATKRDCKYVVRQGSFSYPDEYYSVELYAGHKDGGSKLLRLRTRYYVYKGSRSWIFYNKIQIKGSNGRSVYISTDYPEKKSEVGDGSIVEWADNNVNDIDDDLTEIAKSSSIFVKFYGKYPYEFKMNAEQTAAFKEIIARYNSL
ncbi:MAG: hypothetical protein IKB25_11515 [Lentisphaeria bacterium]|nr:hypothetical protein [Lentisphaeria bacterium]